MSRVTTHLSTALTLLLLTTQPLLASECYKHSDTSRAEEFKDIYGSLLGVTALTKKFTEKDLKKLPSAKEVHKGWIIGWDQSRRCVNKDAIEFEYSFIYLIPKSHSTSEQQEIFFAKLHFNFLPDFRQIEWFDFQNFKITAAYDDAYFNLKDHIEKKVREEITQENTPSKEAQ